MFTIILLAPGLASAAPPPRTDVLWAKSQPWLDVAVPAAARTWTIDVTGLTSDCADPIAARAVERPECSAAVTAGTAIDVVVHVFDPATGRETVAPLHCTSTAPCHADILGGSPRYLVMVHGGPRAHGRILGTLTARAASSTIRQPIDISDNVMIDLSSPPTGGYDLVSILIPDGPGDGSSGGGSDPGNAGNDFLGADATEAWLLDADLRIVHGDLAQAGVGAAALIRHVESFAAARWALVRPWSPPPRGTVLRPGGSALAIADGSKSPTVGAGRMRVIINDVYTHDPDGDGVATAVERDAGTCDGLADWAIGRACVRAGFLRRFPARAWMDPRDTDGDGISDGAEILGSDRAMGTPPTASGSCATAAAPELITDADQTFPLWSFDPRHRDALIEIDREAAGEETCPTTTTGCPADGSAIDVSYDLVEWHARYASLERTRTNNPDRKPGIELHFDARLPTTATAGHGMRPELRLADVSGRMRPGLVIFRPDDGGSQCACDGVAMCADPKHGGYGRYARYSNPGGGGNAGCNGWINYGRWGGGLAASHEMGHHLGLQHGGPTNCLGNPFGVDPALSPEIVLANKMIYVSPMSYLYSYDPRVGFSTGEHGFALPRPDPDDGDRLSYPEDEMFAGFDVTPAARAFGYATSGTTDIDLDYDGAFDHHVRAPVEGQYYEGRDFLTRVNNYWCQTEQEPIWAGGCCTQPTTPGAAHTCIGGGTPTEPTLSRTMLMAGGPATTIADGKWYEFFVDDFVTDDDVPGQVPPRRCGATDQANTGCTPLPPGPQRGKLRWGRITSWSIASEVSSLTPCRGNGSQCGVGVAHGNLAIAGPTTDNDLWGNTVIASATVGAGPSEQVVLAWATRGSASASGFDCSGATCASAWSPLHLRYAASSTIETTGFAPNGAGDLALPAGQDPRVSGVALARWNPTTGAPDLSLIVVRQAMTNRLYFGTCDAGGCGPMRAVAIAGGSVRSFGPIAAAVENVDLARGPQVAIAYTDVVNDVHLLVGTANPTGNLSVVDHELHLPDGGFVEGVAETALSIAFTEPEQNRLVLFYEGGQPTTYVITGRNDTVRAPGPITMMYRSSNPWDLTRPPQRLDATGAAVPPQGPGAIPALVYDGRSGVTDDPRIANLEHRVRVFMSVVGQGALFNQSVTTADGTPDVAYHDYDDVSAMAWALCPTVASSGLGQAVPDLVAPDMPPFQCPSQSDWIRGMFAAALHQFGACHFVGGHCFPWIDPRQKVINPADLVSRFLGHPERWAAKSPVSEKLRHQVTLPPNGLPICSAGASAAAALTRPVVDLKDLARRLPPNLVNTLPKAPPIKAIVVRPQATP